MAQSSKSLFLNHSAHRALLQVAKVRVDYANAETQRVQFADELEALKNTVERTNTDLEKLRSNIRYFAWYREMIYEGVDLLIKKDGLLDLSIPFAIVQSHEERYSRKDEKVDGSKEDGRKAG